MRQRRGGEEDERMERELRASEREREKKKTRDIRGKGREREREKETGVYERMRKCR